MIYPRALPILSAAALSLCLSSVSMAQAISNVVQGATNVVIVNNGAPIVGNPPILSANNLPTDNPTRQFRTVKSFWAHNGSVIALEARGNLRRFTYDRPRSGMAKAGAGPGSLLFEGRRFRDSYAGTARVFAGACGVYAYEVSGPVIADRRIVVSGMMPQVGQRDCQIYGYRNDTLVFDLI